MAVLIVALACKSERTILMPAEIKREMWFQGDNVSASYLESLGEYIAKLLLDITPTSFTHNHEEILKYTTPEAYGSLKKQLMNDGEKYTKLQLSTHFYPNQIIVNKKTLEVEVKGILTNYIAGNKVQDSQETIILKFTNRSANMLLQSVSGGNSHVP
jgi:conjugal transfer pilus assembly protein TraE